MIKYCEIVCVGDLHIGKKSIFPEGNIKQICCVLKQIQEYCNNNNITRIIQLGDLIDTNYPTQEEQILFLDLIKKEPDLYWDVILGNHDWSHEEVYSLKLIKFLSDNKMINNLRIRTGLQLSKINGIPVCYIPYPYITTIKTPYKKVNFAHIEINGCKRDNGHLIDDGLDIKKSKDFWVIGHIHSPQNGKNYLYTGSVVQHSFGEKLDKGFYHLKIKWSKDNMEIDKIFIPIDAPYTLHNLVVENIEDLKIEISDKKLYKLIIKNNVKLPQDYNVKHPNIIKIFGFKNSLEKNAILTDNIITEDFKLNTLDHKQRLKLILQKKEFTFKDIKHALEIIKNIEVNLNNETRGIH